MARKVFFSFHYDVDSWRAATVRSIGKIEGNQPASDNTWEDVKKGGDSAIEKWINDQFSGRSCAVVLVGSDTAGRKWINYEIIKAWNSNKGVVGIRIHNLLNKDSQKSSFGDNPFSTLTIGDENMDKTVKLYNPAGTTSQDVYKTISENIADWIEEAVKIREDN